MGAQHPVSTEKKGRLNRRETKKHRAMYRAEAAAALRGSGAAGKGSSALVVEGEGLHERGRWRELPLVVFGSPHDHRCIWVAFFQECQPQNNRADRGAERHQLRTLPADLRAAAAGGGAGRGGGGAGGGADQAERARAGHLHQATRCFQTPNL